MRDCCYKYRLAFNVSRTFRLLVATALFITFAAAQNLNIRTYNQQGQPLGNVSIVVHTKNGTVRGQTDTNGVTTIRAVNDTLDVEVAKDNYISGRHGMFVNYDTMFHAVLLDKTQYRNGTTSSDTVTARADEMKSVSNVGQSRRNPILLQTTKAVVDSIPTQVVGFSSADSTRIWDMLNWRNDYSGRKMFIPGTVAEMVDRGIRIETSETGSNTDGFWTTEHKHLFNSICYLSDPSLEFLTLHEVSFHGLIYDVGHGTIYSPTNYVANTTVNTQPKDAVYMDLGYLLQFVKGSGKDDFDMIDFNDSVIVQTNHAPGAFAIISPDTVNANISDTLRWSKSIDPDGDWVRYDVHIGGNGKDTTWTIADTLLAIRANLLDTNKAYTISIKATDGLDSAVTSKTVHTLMTWVCNVPFLPKQYVLYQNFPNPFNPSTSITYNLPSESQASIKIYNTLGQQVAILVQGTKQAGSYTVTWKPANATSGLYFIRFEATGVANPSKSFSQVRKMLLLK